MLRQKSVLLRSAVEPDAAVQDDVLGRNARAHRLCRGGGESREFVRHKVGDRAMPSVVHDAQRRAVSCHDFRHPGIAQAGHVVYHIGARVESRLCDFGIERIHRKRRVGRGAYSFQGGQKQTHLFQGAHGLCAGTSGLRADVQDLCAVRRHLDGACRDILPRDAASRPKGIGRDVEDAHDVRPLAESPAAHRKSVHLLSPA